MTDPQLALRAEQALIGALLAEPWHARDRHYANLTLKHPTYQAVAREISGARMYLGALDNPDRLIDQIAERLQLPGVDTAYLTDLARACPNPADIAIYSSMVTEAQVRSYLAGHADRIAAKANTTATEPGQDPQLSALKRLAEVLRRQAAEPVVAEQNNPAPAPYTNTTAVEPVTETQPLTRARQEELILADLLQHRGQVSEVEWLSPEVFAPGPRREIYETIVTVDSYGEPVSELTVEWELDRRRTEAGRQDQPEPDRTDPATGPDYVARLAVTAVAVGVAVEIGGQLLEDTLRVTLAAEAAKILTRSAEPAPATEATATAQPNLTATAVQAGPAAPNPQPLIAPPPTPTGADNQPDIRP